MAKNYIFLQGGFGNQLYMLAYADFLKRQGNKKVKAIALPNKENGDTKDKAKRLLMLDIPNRLNIEMVKFYHRYVYAFVWRLPKFPLYKKIWSKVVKIHQEPRNEWAVFRPEIDSLASYNLHIGYYQSHYYVSDEFKKNVSKAISELVPNVKFSISTNDVAVHIRRGDFFTGGNESIYTNVGISFYLKGLELLSQKIEIKKVYIFSDDFVQIQKEIEIIGAKYEIVLVEKQSVLEDMNTLQQFSNYVLGNSTFSWWGAMISQTDNKNVIVPENPWKIEMKQKSPYPPSWVKLNI